MTSVSVVAIAFAMLFSAFLECKAQNDWKGAPFIYMHIAKTVRGKNILCWVLLLSILKTRMINRVM